MKRWLCLVVLSVLCLNPVYCQVAVMFSPELKVNMLTDDIWVVTHSFPWESNSLVIKASDDEFVLIDTPYTDDATETILQFIQNKANPKHITAILTGFHADNLGGTGCLLRHHIPVYGSDRTCKLLDERSTKTITQMLSWLKSPEQDNFRQAYQTMKFEKPDRVFPIENGLLLNIGKLNFDVFFPGESHSPDNLVVYIKELKLLFGGCMIKSAESTDLGFTGDANLKEWPISVKKVQKKYPEAHYVVPHHGNLGDAALFQHTLDLFKTAHQ